MLIVVALWAVPVAADTTHHEHTDHPAPPWDQADRVWPGEDMAAARAQALHEMGGMPTGFLMADRFEWQSGDEDRVVWDLQGWYGGDIDRFWFKAEGEYSLDEDDVEDAEFQFLWSRALSTFWNLQSGLRYDVEPSGLAHGVIGVQGLAPYWWEMDAAAFISQDGDLTARIEGELDLLLTQRWVLQPRVELNLSASDVPERELGSGLTDAAIGLRLRYELVREFAPYVGVEWQRAFGGTADFREAGGGDASDVVWMIGLRAWY